jgi:hypothetical protein
MYQCGPYGPNHSTAATFAFRRELLNQTQYDATAAIAEEKAFLKNYTIPFVQLDPMKTILVFSHEHNTFDKRKLLEQHPNQWFKESTKQVTDFIRLPKEQKPYDFFITDIDELLKNYEPGNISFKPDAIEQIEKIEKRQGEEQQSKIIVETPDGPIALSNDEIVKLLKEQLGQIQMLESKNQQLENIIVNLQKIVCENNPQLRYLQ